MSVARAWSSSFSRTVWAGILGAATLVIAPWLLRGYTAGHDTAFHVNWWLEYAKHFREGTLHPRWAELAYRGYGEPAFIFYPPLSLFLGGVLTSLLPFRLVLGAYVWLVLALAGFSFFHLCRQFFDERASLLGAVVYVLNPYHLLEVHARCSMAELLVSVWLPLLLLAIYRLGEPGRRRIAAVAMLFAVIALTNIPLAVVTAYGALAFVVALALARKSGVTPVVKFAVAGLLGAGLAGFFLLPAWYEKRWVLASVHAVVPPEAQFVRLSALPFGHWAWALAGVEAGLIVLGALGWLLCRKAEPRDALPAFGVLLAVATIMVLPISAVIWRVAPALVYVQFPWRWLGIVGLAMSFFVAAAVRQSRKGVIFAAGVCAVSVATLGVFSVLVNTKADILLPALRKSFVEGRGYLGWPYVLPRDIKIDEVGIPLYLTAGEPAVSVVGPEAAGRETQSEETPDSWQGAARLALTHWSAEARGVVVDTVQPVWIRFRLFRYPGWTAYVDGKPVDAVASDTRGAMVVPVPSGHSLVEVIYRRTADQSWGMWLTAFSAMVLVWMWFSGEPQAGLASR